MKSKYYKISNPLPENEHTGNVCVNINDVLRFDKDFLFLHKGQEYIVSKEWVKDNIRTLRFTKENENGTRYLCTIYVVRTEDILTNVK